MILKSPKWKMSSRLKYFGVKLIPQNTEFTFVEKNSEKQRKFVL